VRRDEGKSSPWRLPLGGSHCCSPESNWERHVAQGQGGEPSSTNFSTDDVDAHADAIESLPETDVETEFHARLLLMKGVRQLDEDGSLFAHFGGAFVPAQEEGERVARLRVTRPQANRHSHSMRPKAGRGAAAVAPIPEEARAPAASELERLGTSFVAAGRLTHPPSVGSRACLTIPAMGDAGVGVPAYVARV